MLCWMCSLATTYRDTWSETTLIEQIDNSSDKGVPNTIEHAMTSNLNANKHLFLQKVEATVISIATLLATCISLFECGSD